MKTKGSEMKTKGSEMKNTKNSCPVIAPVVQCTCVNSKLKLSHYII